MTGPLMFLVTPSEAPMNSGTPIAHYVADQAWVSVGVPLFDSP